MKKTTLLLISLLLTSAVFCQFTMNSSYNLVPGENYRMDMYNEITSIDPGPSGTNVTWDFSTISGGTYIAGESSFCVNPAGTPYVDSASVAGANLCTRGPGTGNEGPFVYYSMTNADQSILGIGNSQGGGVSFVNYEDPLTGMEFPCSFGSVFSDTYEYMVFNSTSGMYFMKDSGSVVTTVDAWGSITTPEAHYDNVIRLVTTTSSNMYMNFGAGWMFTGTNTDISYSWMAKDIKINVFSITEFITAGGYTLSYLMDHNFPMGIQEKEELSFEMYPNPATERVNIKSKKPIETINLYNIHGRMLQSHELHQGVAESTLDLKQCPKGIYLVEIRYGKGEVSHERLVKQ
jgi:hypothetical protein